MESGRKRASLACNYCRRRKRRCNGGIPSCGLCEDSGIDCVYNEIDPSRARGATSSSQFFRRLDAIENYIWSHQRLPQTPQTGEARSGGFTFPSSEHERADFSHPSTMLISSPSRPNPADISQLISANPSSFIPPEHDIPPMSIPIGHTTTTEYMLHMNKVKTLFGEFPPDLFIRAESKRHMPHQLSFVPGTITASQLPVLDEANTYLLVDAYFKHVHVEMPILDRDQFLGHYDHHLRAGLSVDCDSALCLAVLALGSAALEQTDPTKSSSPDLIAEHHLPRSGIEHVIDLTPFPSFANHDAQETHVFLAELSVRRLLNRVHHTMYGSDWTRRSLGLQPASSDSPSYDFQSLSTILNVSQELDRQLENWYDLLPRTIKPDIHDPSRCTGLQLNMLHRFHSAKDIITRPFLLCAIDSPPENDLPPMVLRQCESSIANCRAYLDASARRLMGPSFSAEIIIHTLCLSGFGALGIGY
ncbi:hypothetical protein PENCOP_c003G04729 [Penicillium coprophilum]|uniref:Zn(2)-C6 fungal-type domain-containing protein n=1 Tax=Penicillium coprophilum TaxID=36646 RepID=A0A1V6UXU1_9EURO|nr:hypothetical protein PENCOP_c003G04729 [Penicillium coprophilum]